MDKIRYQMELMARHMLFFDENHVRILNPEGIDCLIKWREMKVVAFHKSTNYCEDYFSGNTHPLLDKIPDEKSTIKLLPRLNNICHQIAMMVEIDIYQERNLGVHGSDQTKKIEKLEQLELIQREFTTRKFLGGCFWLAENTDEDQSDSVYFECEKSFTMLDWLLIENLLISGNLKTEYISEDQYIRLFFNVLPGSLQVLHYLAISNEPKHMEMARRGYELAASRDIEIPLKYDSKGRLPLDLILDVNQSGLAYSIFFQPVKRNYHSKKIRLKIKSADEFKVNVIFASLLFDSMKNYSFASSGMKLAKPIIKAIELNVPNIEDFLLRRCCLSQNQPYLVQHKIKPRSWLPGQELMLYDTDNTAHLLNYGVTTA